MVSIDVKDKQAAKEDHEIKDQNMDENDEDSPIEEVRVTVSNQDDPTLAVYTFRMWSLGLISCVILTFVNTFFHYRTEPLFISVITMQIGTYPLGKLMARVLPTTKFRILGCGERKFSLNPGPFNIKEHVLITIFGGSGGNTYGANLVAIIKTFYHRTISIHTGWILIVTSQVLGYGFAGIFRKYVVEPPEMWWPGNMAFVTLFRTFHGKDDKYSSSRLKFFIIALACSFLWYIVPGYLFMTASNISLLCYIFPKSVIAHQIGSGMKGLGVLSFTLDWAAVSSFLGSPLVSPFLTVVNVLVGYVFLVYGILPLAYWGMNLYNAQNFPMISSHLFNASGKKYDVDSIVNQNFELDIPAYNKQGRINLSIFFAIAYGLNFASIVATLVHVGLFNGKKIYRQFKSSNVGKPDIHTRLMSKYKSVPGWWFNAILVVSFCLGLAMCIFMKHEIQLPWWGLIMAVAMAFVFTLPICIITATTNVAPGLNVITEYVFGYILPGLPIANVAFKTYGYMSMSQGISFLQDFKLGLYMKIPPRSMFFVQLLGTLIASTLNLGITWWLISAIKNICQDDLLPANSPWTCPSGRVFYDASVIWGLVGPKRMFGTDGNYNALNYGFLIGGVLPLIVWLLHKAFPTKSWIKLINFPVILSATAGMPPASTINFNSWIVVGTIFQYFIFKYKKKWWEKYNYVLSAALDGGLAFMAVLIYFAFGSNGINIDWWGNQGEHCDLASCPIGKGIVVDGCPIQ